MIVVSVVDYNSAAKTYEYIQHCAKKFVCDEIAFIIVDNSCNEENFNNLVSIFSIKESIEFNGLKGVCGTDKAGITVVAIMNNKNSGYGNGNNIAFRIAKKLWEFDYFIVSNNDLIIQNDILTKEMLDSAFDEKNIGLIGPEIINIDGMRQSPNRKCGIMHRWFWAFFLYPFLKYDATDLESTDKKFVYYVNGSFMIFKKEAFEMCNGFDSNTFLYAEEPIIAERLNSVGLRVRYFPAIRILHNHSEVISKYYDVLKKTKLRYTSDRYYFMQYRKVNRFVLAVCDLNFMCFSLKFKAVRAIRGVFR